MLGVKRKISRPPCHSSEAKNLNLQPGHQALLSAADRAREGRTGGGHAQASVHLECDAPAQSAVEAELVSEHPLTFNTVTQEGIRCLFSRVSAINLSAR